MWSYYIAEWLTELASALIGFFVFLLQIIAWFIGIGITIALLGWMGWWAFLWVPVGALVALRIAVRCIPE